MALTKQQKALKAKDKRNKECFNLDPGESDKIEQHQGGCCAICKVPSYVFKKSLAVDHDHRSGLTRGRLCWHCNRLLGMARDNPERLLNAALYLVCPPAVIALGGARFGLPGRAGTKKQKRFAKKLVKNPVIRNFIIKDPVLWLQSVVESLKGVSNGK